MQENLNFHLSLCLTMPFLVWNCHEMLEIDKPHAQQVNSICYITNLC